MLIMNGRVLSQDNHPDKKDTAKIQPPAKSSLKYQVNYDALDSMRLDVPNQRLYLYGQAKVLYENMKLEADYIEFDMLMNIAYARGTKDSTGKNILDSSGLQIGRPVFTEGSKTFDAREITYNFKTKKGKIDDVVTQEGEAYIHARESKKDTGNIYYIKNGKYTTCNLEHPHFYLNLSKIKIIQNDKIVCGPGYLVLEDVITPLGIPFGVFPNKIGRKSGILIPSYGESDLGFFLKDGGYYFGISDYFDASLRGDFYSKGSYGVRENTNYAKRYKFNGSVGFKFSQIQISEKEFPDYKKTKDFRISWQHRQDPRSNPTSQFSASVDAGTSTYQKYNSYNPNDYLSNTMSSNIAWSKTWSQYNLGVNMYHNQSTLLKTVDITLPEISFSRSTWHPFQRNVVTGKPKFYEKLGVGFAYNAKNQVSTYDSLLFTPNTINRIKNGMQLSIPISTSLNFGPFVMSPSFNFRSVGYFQSYQRKYVQRKSSAKVDSMVVDTINGFKYGADYSTGVSVSTKLFGMYLFKIGPVKAIRHVLTPSISYNYRPDFGEYNYGYFYKLTDPTNRVTTLYSVFENSMLYGSPQPGESQSINFSLNNNLEMKIHPSKKDSSNTDRKISIFDNFSISTGYNFVAQHFKYSNISMSGNTRLFKKIDITINGIINPYAFRYDYTAKRYLDRDTLLYNLTGKVGRLTNASLSFNTSLRSLVKKDEKTTMVQPSLHNRNPDEVNYILSHPTYYVDFNMPWNLVLAYTISYESPFLRDTITQTISFSGDVNITKKWKIGFRSGFDFAKKDVTLTSFDIYRDLHCWELRLNWIPFGFRRSYMLTVAVKASVLQDLKLSRTRQWYDNN